MGARQTHLSNHLRVLRDSGPVETEPAGRFTYYRLRPEALASLAARLRRAIVPARYLHFGALPVSVARTVHRGSADD